MPVRIKYFKKENGTQRGSLSIRSWRTQCDWGYPLVVMTQIVKEYLACSWQLTADGFYPHTGFPHHGNRSFAVALDDILPYSPSRRQILHVRSGWRLTFPSLWRFFIQLSFWTGVRMPYEKDEKRNSGMEWRIYYTDDVLLSSSPR